MASFFDITTGQQIDFQRVLASKGFTASDIVRVIEEPNLASLMHTSIQLNAQVDVPSWYVSPEQQLERARRLWPNAVLPDLPAEFISRTKTEVLLLHVPEPFDSLWDRVVAPEGFSKYRGKEFVHNKPSMRLAPGKLEFAKPVWLAFDPEHGRGDSAESFWGREDIAASEIFSALIQFPEWPLAWLDGAPAPFLTGYQLKFESEWSGVPLVHWLYSTENMLDLWGGWASGQSNSWSSPTVRVC